MKRRTMLALASAVAVIAALVAVSVSAAAHPAGAASFNLYAGQTTLVGNVYVWNDATNLYVEIDMATGWCMTESHVAAASNVTGIPQNSQQNPTPGQFQQGDSYAPCEAGGDTFQFALSGLDATPVIAVHAKVWDQTHVAAMNVYSDAGNTTVISTTAPGGVLSPTAVDAWEPYLNTDPSAWDAGVALSYVFQYADWIWSDFRVRTPTVDETVTFQRTFNVPGPVAPGSFMKVTTDDAYTASLNGTQVAADTHPNWPSVESASPFDPVWGSNMLRFVATNSNLSWGIAGTIDNNPGGLIYEARVNYYTHSESAWAGTAVGQIPFNPSKSWATYFGYGVQEYVFGDTGVNTPYGFVNLDFEVWGGPPVSGTTSWVRTVSNANAWEGPVVAAAIDATTASFTVRVATGTPAGIDQCDIAIAVTEGGPGLGIWNITSVVNSPSETCPYAGQVQGPYTITSGSIDVFSP